MSSRRFSVFFLVVVFIVLAGLLAIGSFISAIVQPASLDPSTVTVTIAKGEHVHDIATGLESAGVIKSPLYFELYVWLRHWGSHLQAGVYHIPKNITIRSLAESMAQGRDASSEVTVTTIEGWTESDMALALERQGVVTGAEFRSAASQLATQSSLSSLADKPKAASLEGYLFPDTYRFYRGASGQDIVSKMLDNFDAKLTPDLRAAIVRNQRSVFQTVIMASILEKEVKNPSDLPLVADIFYRRLAAGQALQSDATLHYVIGGKDPQLTASQLQNPSPYNTYRHTGLPPGPISNPGLNALRAAINPRANDYWYFLTTPDGVTIFAQNYKEQVANKKRYLP